MTLRLSVLLLAIAGIVVRADGGSAADAARRAMAEGSAPSANRFRLEACGERHGCAFVPGSNGLVDGELAFTDGQRTVTFQGFDVWNGRDARGATSGAPSPLEWRFSEEGGVLRLRVSCETTNEVCLALGPADEKVFRAYGGTGYMVEKTVRGGNLLLDVGPDEHGLIPPIMEDRLIAMGRWLAVNGEAIYATRAWNERPSDMRKDHVYYTEKPDALYVIVARWPQGELRVRKMAGVRSVSLLGSELPVTFRADGGDLVITPPAMNPGNMPCEHAWTFKLVK